MRRIAGVLIGLAVLAIVVGVAPGVVHAGGPFTDDDDSIFESDINWLAAEGITKGCNPPSNTRFCPNASVTRGQMAAFLVRALGYTTNPPGDRFTDDNGSIFEADIEKLAAAGVTKGCNPPSNTRFCPNASVTRGQMAAFLVRALGYTTNPPGDRFTDDNGSIFEADIEKLAAAGVTKGCNPPSNTRFCPNASVTRGQMAAFLHRALGRNAPGYEYIEVADDTGTLSMQVPTVWNDVDGRSWEFEGELVGPAVSAAPNLDRFLGTWTTPGVFFGALRSDPKTEHLAERARCTAQLRSTPSPAGSSADRSTCRRPPRS